MAMDWRKIKHSKGRIPFLEIRLYSYYFTRGFPIFTTVFPARSLIMIPAIIYQADMAQNINSHPAITMNTGLPKWQISSRMKIKSEVPEVIALVF